MNIIIKSDNKTTGNDNNFQYQLNYGDVNLLNKNYLVKVNSCMIYPGSTNRNFNNKYFYEVRIQNLGNTSILDGTEQSYISFFISNTTYSNSHQLNNLNFYINNLNPFFTVSIYDNTGALLTDSNNSAAKIVLHLTLEKSD